MGFYMQELRLKCEWIYCKKTATREVKRSGTDSYGKYCTKHANQKITQLEDAFSR